MDLVVSDTYGLDPDFERAAVTVLCCTPALYNLIGAHINPDGIDDPVAKLALRAAKQISKDLGNGPDSTLLIIQRLKRWMRDGKAKQEDIDNVLDLFEAAEDMGLPSHESLLEELKPIIKRKVQHSQVMKLVDAHSKYQNVEHLLTELGNTQRIGETSDSLGIRVGPGSFAAIKSIRHLEKLPFDIPEMDQEIGGLPRKALGVLIGGPGDGKSMALEHFLVAGMLRGLRCIYATLELPEPVVLARIKANLTGIPIDTILNGDMTKAMEKLDAMSGQLGMCIVKEFTPYATTHLDIIEWTKAVEQKEGEAVDLVVTDYGDKLVAAIKGDARSYENDRITFEGLRVDAVANNRWHWTASQSTRKGGKDKKKRIDLNDVADSMHKVRVADLVITLNIDDAGEMIEMFVPKNRHGKSRQIIGPMPHEFEIGRLAAVQRVDEDFEDSAPY